MKPIVDTRRATGTSLFCALALGCGIPCWGLPAIQSVQVNPKPLVAGQTFTVTAMASSDVVLGVATVDFRPSLPRLLRVPLALQGGAWTGTGTVPATIQLPAGEEATVTVLLFDSARQRAEATTKVGVASGGIVAIFNAATGVLTITGDDQDNSIAVSGDTGGNILVNDGLVPITGGVPTIANTVLIRAFGLGGRDDIRINEAGGALPPAEFHGGDGNDTLTGGSAADQLFGDGDDDLLVGRRGSDVMDGGNGKDTAVWNPGDGSDVVEGGADEDVLLFNGANISERIDVSANGSRLRFTRDVGNIVMDCDGIEVVTFNALGGADVVTVNDLAGTSVTRVLVDLASPAGSGTGDGQSDTIVVNGTASDDALAVSGSAGAVRVTGLSAAVDVLGADPLSDSLVVNTLGGADVLDATGLEAGEIKLTANGGPQADLLIGGPGDELFIGGQGDDAILAGDGDDTMIWNPGDGDDTLEGQKGADVLLFNGANISEVIDIAANGGRVRFTRNVANIIMDLNDVEQVVFNALGGSDIVSVHDLSGTDVTGVILDLAVPAGSGTGDTQPDSVIVDGTAGDDVIVVAGSGSSLSVLGLAAQVTLLGSEETQDRLTVNALDGDDVIEASGLASGVIQLTGDGGSGNDILIGSAGTDVLLGGPGDDVLIGGAGLDVLDGGTGDNIVIQ